MKGAIDSLALNNLEEKRSCYRSSGMNLNISLKEKLNAHNKFSSLASLGVLTILLFRSEVKLNLYHPFKAKEAENYKRIEHRNEICLLSMQPTG